KGIFTLSEGEGLTALGWKSGEMVGRSIFDIYGDNPEVLGNFRRALAGAAFSRAVEVGALTFEARYSPLTNDDDQVIGVIGVAIDISENRKAQKALQENEERYRELF